VFPQAQALAPLLEPATKSPDVTLAMAIVSFIAFMGLGILKAFEPAPGHTHEAGDHGHDHEHHHDGGGFFGWLSHYVHPVPMLSKSMEGAMRFLLIPLLFLFIFLNIVEELARILSLTFRLFGNIFGEHQTKTQILALVGTFSGQAFHALAPGGAGVAGLLGFGFMALILWAVLLFVVCLGTLAGFIQAFVFSLLTMSYIAHAVAVHD
jgi:F0F1-type ATP synthase membrane subunit a